METWQKPSLFTGGSLTYSKFVTVALFERDNYQMNFSVVVWDTQMFSTVSQLKGRYNGPNNESAHSR